MMLPLYPAPPPLGPSARRSPVADPHGRAIGYLRLSLTKACSMRCTYCRPAKLGHTRGEPMLTVQEAGHLVRHLAQRHGLRKVRLTGGDPTSRPDLVKFIRAIRAIDGITDLAMTTNGLTLLHRAAAYADAGLDRINVSLDSLDAARFASMTGVDGLSRVLAGLDAAERAGLSPIRLNCVVLKDQNERDLPDLLRFAAARGMEIRFIELMPMGPLASQWADRYVPEAAMRRRLEAVASGWHPLEQGHDAARRYRVSLGDGTQGVVGFITPMSCNFCSSCNRVRVAADGALYPCLMDEPRDSLLPALRPRFDADHLDELLARGLAHKQAEHPHDGFVTMTHIGG